MQVLGAFTVISAQEMRLVVREEIRRQAAAAQRCASGSGLTVGSLWAGILLRLVAAVDAA